MRKLTATIASVALAGSLAIPAPVSAETSDVAKALAGIAAIAIIAKAIDDRRDRKSSYTYNSGDFGSYEQYDGRRTIDRTIRRHDDSRYDNDGYDNNRNSNNRYDNRRYDDRRYDRSRHNKRGPKAGRGYKKHPLPQACLRDVAALRGDRLGYGARCVNRNFKFASKLPDYCVTQVRTRRGYRAMYSARCLRRDGWKAASR